MAVGRGVGGRGRIDRRKIPGGRRAGYHAGRSHPLISDPRQQSTKCVTGSFRPRSRAFIFRTAVNSSPSLRETPNVSSGIAVLPAASAPLALFSRLKIPHAPITRHHAPPAPSRARCSVRPHFSGGAARAAQRRGCAGGPPGRRAPARSERRAPFARREACKRRARRPRRGPRAPTRPACQRVVVVEHAHDRRVEVVHLPRARRRTCFRRRPQPSRRPARPARSASRRACPGGILPDAPASPPELSPCT